MSLIFICYFMVMRHPLITMFKCLTLTHKYSKHTLRDCTLEVQQGAELCASHQAAAEGWVSCSQMFYQTHRVTLGVNNTLVNFLQVYFPPCVSPFRRDMAEHLTIKVKMSYSTILLEANNCLTFARTFSLYSGLQGKLKGCLLISL